MAIFFCKTLDFGLKISLCMAKAFVSNDDESIRLFENGALDALTKVHPATPPAIYIPLIIYLLIHSSKTYHLTALESVEFFSAGLLFWTFFEYCMHRFLFHAE